MITPEELLKFVADVATLTANLPKPPGLAYRTMYEFLARHGRVFPVAADQRIPDKSPACYAGGCFVNARRLASRYPRRFRYVEGLAAGPIPLHHAWTINAADEVVDPTWSKHSTIGTAYLGVVFDLADVRRFTSRRNASVLDQWERRHPAFAREWTGRVRRAGAA